MICYALHLTPELVCDTVDLDSESQATLAQEMSCCPFNSSTACFMKLLNMI
ncbi:MAG: hypothetical protein ACR5K7_04525 [Symbiopectobacterium sp.]